MKIASSAFAMVVLFSCISFAKSQLVNIELKWKGTTEMKAFSKVDYTVATTRKIKITTLKDSRKEPRNRVGENKEEKDEFRPVETNSNVPEFVTSNFKNVLEKAGFEIVESGEEFVLTGEIDEYFIDEVNTYKGNLTMRLQLTKQGKQVWKGLIVGSNTRFGRSYKLDNYLESLSDVIIDAALELVKNDKFITAFK